MSKWECSQWDIYRSKAVYETRTGFPSVASGFAIVDRIETSHPEDVIFYQNYIHLFISPEEDKRIPVGYGDCLQVMKCKK